MTNQEAFDKVWDYFVAQGNESAMEGLTCRLRTRDGRKCAIGCLIPDKVYEPYMDRLTIDEFDDLLYSHVSLEPLFYGTDREFIDELRSAHDRDSGSIGDQFTKDIRLNLLDLAAGFDLLVPSNH